MTKEYCQTKHRNTDRATDHRIYGGKIYQGDYDEYHSIADMAARILADQRFDLQCMRNTEYRIQTKQLQEAVV